MNEWLEEELAELERGKTRKPTDNNWLSLLQFQTAILWIDLKPVLKDAVEKLNTTLNFRKRTGGLVYAYVEDREIRKKQLRPPWNWF